LVEEGFEAVLERKHSPASARARIFDGAGEAKLIALTCSPPPKGRARWTLRLLEDKVVELNIVGRVSDNTIGRTLKKLGWQNQLVPARACGRSSFGGADGQDINPRAAGSGRGAVAGAEGLPGLRPRDATSLR
jgi:hypothetical protein